MSITLTLLGDTLDVTVVDGNFDAIMSKLIADVRESEFASAIGRFHVRAFTHGKIVQSLGFNNPYRNSDGRATGQTFDILDITLRGVSDDWRKSDVFEHDVITVKNRDGSTYLPIPWLGRMKNSPLNQSYELLGRPGPSFIWDWQERGYNPSLLSGVLGYPPVGYDAGRFPEDLCYSRWITVPGASMKVYVPHACVARVRGSFMGNLALSKAITRFDNLCTSTNVTGSARTLGAPAAWTKWRYGSFLREGFAGRFGLIVDTNPVLYEDEFANSNPNIDAPYVTWKVIADRTWYLGGLRETNDLVGVTPLRGGRWYNIRLAYRAAGTYGWIPFSEGGTKEFIPSVYESSTDRLAEGGSVYNDEVLPNLHDPFYPAWLQMWEGGNVSATFAYGQTAVGE
jgi:hypothetical protein